MSEWLRRQTRNLLGFACAGSNPAVDDFFLFIYFLSPAQVRSTGKSRYKKFRYQILILFFGSGYFHEENRL